jgi:hypothetical protein
MSANSGGLTPDFSESDVDIKKGFGIVGIVFLFLMTLVILRLGCNFFIDVVILRDNESLIRAASQLRRVSYPWWHPRTQPQGAPAVPTPSSPTSTTELVSMDRLLMGLTPQQKQELLASILMSKVSAIQADRHESDIIPFLF